MASFFSTYANEIKTFLKVLEKYTGDPQYSEFLKGPYEKKAKLISDYLAELVEKKVGDNAQIAINNLGGQVEAIIKTTAERTKENLETDLDTLMNFLGQVAQELLLREERGTGKAAIEILNYFFYSEDRTDEEKYLGLYFTAKLPLLIYSEVMSDKKTGVAAKLADVETKVDDLNTRLYNVVQAKAEVSELANELAKQKVTFNFLGLSAAFNQFYKSKRNYLWQSLAMMVVIGIALFVIPLFSLSRVDKLNFGQSQLKQLDEQVVAIKKLSDKQDKQQSKTSKEIITNLESIRKQIELNILKQYAVFALPLLAVEFLLLYFFRIVLHSYTNSRSQIMQLQLRNSVCQFIENYVKFRKDNKEVESGFEKFEALVFSGLAPSDDKVPSTFDGLEQLSKLIKDAKG